MIDADKVLARLREQEAVHRRTNRLPYAEEYLEEITLIEELRKDARRYRWLNAWGKTGGFSELAIDREIAIDAALSVLGGNMQ